MFSHEKKKMKVKPKLAKKGELILKMATWRGLSSSPRAHPWPHKWPGLERYLSLLLASLFLQPACDRHAKFAWESPLTAPCTTRGAPQ